MLPMPSYDPYIPPGGRVTAVARRNKRDLGVRQFPVRGSDATAATGEAFVSTYQRP
jgi:hypothetical protein